MRRPFPWFRWAVQTVLGVTLGDETNSTFVAADATPALDTPTDLTFTLKDANDDPIAGAAVTYA